MYVKVNFMARAPTAFSHFGSAWWSEVDVQRELVHTGYCHVDTKLLK